MTHILFWTIGLSAGLIAIGLIIRYRQQHSLRVDDAIKLIVFAVLEALGVVFGVEGVVFALTGTVPESGDVKILAFAGGASMSVASLYAYYYDIFQRPKPP